MHSTYLSSVLFCIIFHLQRQGFSITIWLCYKYAKELLRDTRREFETAKKNNKSSNNWTVKRRINESIWKLWRKNSKQPDWANGNVVYALQSSSPPRFHWNGWNQRSATTDCPIIFRHVYECMCYLCDECIYTPANCLFVPITH